MNEKTYEKLMSKLDALEQKITTHPVPSSAEASNIGASAELLSQDTNVDLIEKQQLPLVHTMLHMFYANRNGRGLTPKTIEKLHKELTTKLKLHVPYDKLDYKE